jgi:hypothetical protein
MRLPKGVKLSKKSVLNEPKFQEVLVPMFEIASCPSVSINDIKNRRFKLVEDEEGVLVIKNRKRCNEKGV